MQRSFMDDLTDNSIRVIIIDDHPVVRYGVRHVLETDPAILVVGELECVRGIAEKLADMRPDVVLLDLELGDVCGVEALRILRDASPDVRVIVYTTHDDEDSIIEAAELGIDGYLLKGSPKEEIIGAVRSVSDGGTAIEPAVAAKLMQHMNKRSAKTSEPVIRFSNREVGKALFISESTVKFHVHAILNKLDASNRTEAVSLAVQLGVVSLANGH